MAHAADKSSTRKPKLVRDSFTIPKNEYAAIDALKARAIALGTSVKKSELLRAGLMALLMRVQLISAENTFLAPGTYNGLFTMHGSTMMFLFAVPMLEGFAIYLLPLLLGNREMPFPRLGVFSFFTFALGGILFFSSFLFDAVPNTGWFAYVPLSGPQFSPGLALDFWLLGLGVMCSNASNIATELTENSVRRPDLLQLYNHEMTVGRSAQEIERSNLDLLLSLN